MAALPSFFIFLYSKGISEHSPKVILPALCSIVDISIVLGFIGSLHKKDSNIQPKGLDNRLIFQYFSKKILLPLYIN